MKGTYSAINALLVAVAMSGQAMAANSTPSASEKSTAVSPSSSAGGEKKLHASTRHHARVRNHDGAARPQKS